MVIPLGRPSEPQTLQRIEKHADGTITARDVLPVAFVPLV
jgi:protein-L-isoaspartate O-methyltransferase